MEPRKIVGHRAGVCAICPSYGADVGKRMSLRTIRYLALATIGLFSLYWWSQHRDLVNTCHVEEFQGKLEARDLKQGHGGGPGRAEGPDDDPNPPGRDQKQEENSPMAIAALKPEHAGENVKIQGRVRERQVLPEGVKLVVEDETGKIEVMLSKDIFHLHGHFYRIKAEYTVKVAGKLAVVGGMKQVRPNSPADIEIVSLPPLTPKPQVAEKREATVTGKVLGSYVIPPGIRLVLTKVRGMPADYQMKPWDRLDVVLPKPGIEEVEYFRVLARGSIVKVRGSIETYRDRYHLQIASSAAISKITEVKGDPAESKPVPVDYENEPSEIEEDPWVPISTSRQISAQELHAPLLLSGTLVRDGDEWKLEIENQRLTLILGPAVDPKTLAPAGVRVRGSLTRENGEVKFYAVAVETK